MFNSIDPLDVDQRTTYTVAMNCMFDPEKIQLIVFISGESGTEKSRLAHVIAQGCSAYVQYVQGVRVSNKVLRAWRAQSFLERKEQRK